MKILLMTAFLVLTFSTAVFAQKLEDNCAIGAWITDQDPAGLNIRDKPSVKGKILAKFAPVKTIEDQVSVYVVGYSNGWVKIAGPAKIADGKTFDDSGWVSAKMIAFSVKNNGDNADQPVSLYEKPDNSSKKLGTIPSGTTDARIVAYDCFGLKVIYKGKTGWIKAGNVCGSASGGCQ